MSISKRSLIFVSATLAAIACFAHDRQAVAQEYQGMEMPAKYELTPLPYKPTQDTNEAKREYLKELREWKKEGNNPQAISAIRAGQSKLKEVLAAGGDVTADAEAKKFLDEYTFTSMTQTDPDTLSSLGDKRQSFLKNYLNSRVTGSARSTFLDLTIQRLQAVSTNAALHPSARVNAIVLLSQLTDRPLARDQAPIASANAFKALLSIFNGNDPKQNPEFVKVAALSGIKHQLEMNSKSGQEVAPAVKNQLVAAAVEFMAAPSDRDANAAAYWKKRQSVQLAGILKDAKTWPGLLAILDDETASLDLKLEVVRTIAKTGALDSAPKASSAALVSICKFAQSSVANEGTHLQDSVDQMVRTGMLYGEKDLRAEGIDFQPADKMGGGGDDFGGGFGGNRRNGFGARQTEEADPMIELPNYQVQITRNRLRAIAMFCRQAIGKDKQSGLRPNLETKAENLATATYSQLGSLLNKSELGLYDLEERRRSGDPTPSEMDQARKDSYVNQMTKLCETHSEAIAKQLEGFIAE